LQHAGASFVSGSRRRHHQRGGSLACEHRTADRIWIATLLALAVVLSLREVLLPFVAGKVLAYLLDPLADRIKRLGMNRLPATRPEHNKLTWRSR
jgi:hypothetical protein